MNIKFFNLCWILSITSPIFEIEINKALTANIFKSVEAPITYSTPNAESIRFPKMKKSNIAGITKRNMNLRDFNKIFFKSFSLYEPSAKRDCDTPIGIT